MCDLVRTKSCKPPHFLQRSSDARQHTRHLTRRPLAAPTRSANPTIGETLGDGAKRCKARRLKVADCQREIIRAGLSVRRSCRAAGSAGGFIEGLPPVL